jgi:hypothetical protein
MVAVFSVVWILFGKKCDTKKEKRQREREVPEPDARGPKFSLQIET